MKEVAAIQEIEERLEIEELLRRLDTARPTSDPSGRKLEQKRCVSPGSE